MTPPTWAYNITMEADDADHAEILIYTPIGKSFWDPDRVDANAFVKQLNDLDVSTIELRVNSPGGVVYDGVAIHNALRRHKAEVTVVVEGLCASIATVIALAADKLLMCPTSWFMIHNASVVTWGNKTEIARDVEQLTKIDKAIVAAYAAKSGQDPEWLAAEMEREAWYTPDEALEHGFIDGILDLDADDDEVEDPLASVNVAAIAQFRNAPQQVVERMQPAAGPIPTLPQAPLEPVQLDGVTAPAAAAPAPAPQPSAWEVDVARARREREAASD